MFKFFMSLPLEVRIAIVFLLVVFAGLVIIAPAIMGFITLLALITVALIVIFHYLDQ